MLRDAALISIVIYLIGCEARAAETNNFETSRSLGISGNQACRNSGEHAFYECESGVISVGGPSIGLTTNISMTSVCFSSPLGPSAFRQEPKDRYVLCISVC